jgi:hypothetical protein
MKLSEDIYSIILSYIDPTDYYQCRRVSWLFYHIITRCERYQHITQYPEILYQLQKINKVGYVTTNEFEIYYNDEPHQNVEDHPIQ